MMVVPEYLTNLTGLSNSLAVLNPTAGTQLYDTIAECTKKEQLFNNHQGQPQSQTTVQQQQRSNNNVSTSGTAYINATEDFIMKTKNSGHDMNSTDLLNEFNLRMFLNNGSESGAGGGGASSVATPNTHVQEFLNDQPLFGAGVTPTPNPPTNTSQSPMMQMWMNSFAANQTNHIPTQHALIGNAQQAVGINNQWLNGPLVGIPPINLSRERNAAVGRIMSSPKPTPASMWDVATLEQHVQVQQKQQHEQQQSQQQSFEHPQDQQQEDTDKLINTQHQHQHSDDNNQEHQQQGSTNELQKSSDSVRKPSSANNNSKQEHQHSPLQPIVTEKSHSHINNNKRNVTNNNIVKPANKAKNENSVEQISKKSDEERRRELNEEKRRQKEERKRHQMEEDKRRLMQAEEEKRRQIQEEEKRQQQIQAHRRKALMSSTNNQNSSNNNNANNSLLSTNNVGNPKSKEQQRIQSSVAPWSTQTMATKSQGPGLAEIQKAERRERRADQQRQLEIQEKQMRALAAAAEAQDTVLKWNAAPVPVKSFAEIQAEEAKRLAHEQIELQRRKEQEVHNNLVAFNSAGGAAAGGISNSSNISSIWSGNKIWGSPSPNTTGFWEEPLKLNSKSINACLSNSNNNSNLTAALIVAQSTTLQPKLATSLQQQQHPLSQQSLNKSIKKSQSVAVMQNAISPTIANTSGGPNIQKKTSNNTTPALKQAKLQKSDNNGAGITTHESKKSATKNNNAANKGDDYEAEFTNWCTKSLNNMNTKVDVPTFVSFLRDLESPYEVKDYIRMYLGESKEYIDFSKQFLERRSKYKNLQRAQNAHDDDLCKPALAITPSVNDNSENKGKQKKLKKNKMTKLDARILGFSVTAAEGRINVGDRDYGDAP